MGDKHAPHPKSTPAEVQSRIDHICELMSRNQYEGWLTVSELMRKWDLSRDTVQRYSDTASRQLKTPPERRDALRSQLAASFQGIAREAIRSVNRVTGQPDLKNAMEALKLYAEYSGVAPTAEELGQVDTKPIINIVYAHVPDDKKGDADEVGK